MATSETPTLEGLATHVLNLTQQNEQLNVAFSTLQADSSSRINKLEADFAQLANYTR